MLSPSGSRSVLLAVAAVLGCVAVTSLIRTQPAYAQQQPTGDLSVWLQPSQPGTFMVTVVGQDGSIKGQKEGVCCSMNLAVLERFSIAPGIYDVRFEGDGFTTLVKRGIAVVAGTSTDINSQMVKGQGVHVVEYATAISGSDFMARLIRLEKAIAELTKK